MREVLERLEQDELPHLLRIPSMWNGVLVNYHPPVVERLWCPWGDYRVYLHRILPCNREEALFHPHPWPSIMRVLEGSYEMGYGVSAGEKAPPVSLRIELPAKTVYEMTDQDGWHYVRPLNIPVMSLMLTGKPWGRSAPKSEAPLPELTQHATRELFEFFRREYEVIC